MLRTIIFLCAAVLCSCLQATSLGQVAIDDPVLGKRTIVYERVNDHAVVEGDILIGKISSLNKPGAVVIPKIGHTRWPEGTIPYEMGSDLPFRNKLAVLQAIDHWQKMTHLEFVERTDRNDALYPDYISFTAAEGTKCWSYIGRKGGKQEIYLSPRCTTMNTVHEIGHALGLWHEQSRSDRDSYIRIIWENIEPDHRYNFDQHLSDGKDYGYYDYDSIMHYGTHAFSKNGQPTIIPLDDKAEIGQRQYLSNQDIEVIKAMYPEV